uniref:Odorant receptor n=1 Tax=Sirex noctilio TaxID=36765 RepID=A0A857N394_9HYME|nr:odorant receptor 15 [Sirex noctilio]
MSIDEYVFTNQIILKLVGLYPTSVIRCLVCLLCMLLIVIPQVIQIYFNRYDLAVILETSSVLLTILLAMLKSIVWILNQNTMESLVRFMLTDYWKIAEILDDTHYFITYAKSARKVTKSYLILIFNALLFFFSLPPIEILIAKTNGALNVDKHFPFSATYPTFCYESFSFEVIYASQMIATIVCGLVILATDTLIATALLHTCGHFAILQKNLMKLNDDLDYIKHLTNNSKKLDEISRILRQKMFRLVKHHQIIIRFSDDMEKAFSPIMLLQVFASNLIICLVGLQVSTTLTDRYKLIQYSSYLLMALFQLLLFCWPGDNLIVQSSMVSKTAYSVNWYEASILIKAEILFIILRSQKPSCITAGKFYVMCLENFSTVLSTSLSYFTVLRSLN